MVNTVCSLITIFGLIGIVHEIVQIRKERKEEGIK